MVRKKWIYFDRVAIKNSQICFQPRINNQKEKIWIGSWKNQRSFSPVRSSVWINVLLSLILWNYLIFESYSDQRLNRVRGARLTSTLACSTPLASAFPTAISPPLTSFFISLIPRSGIRASGFYTFRFIREVNIYLRFDLTGAFAWSICAIFENFSSWSFTFVEWLRRVPA